MLFTKTRGFNQRWALDPGLATRTFFNLIITSRERYSYNTLKTRNFNPLVLLLRLLTDLFLYDIVYFVVKRAEKGVKL